MGESKDQPKDVPEQLNLTPDAAVREISDRAAQLANDGQRVFVGIAGGPGVGKSTLAEAIVATLNQSHKGLAALLPLDGFHLPHAELVARDLVAEKGMPHTFDPQAFITQLNELRFSEETILLPAYDRAIEDVVANRLTVLPNAGIIVTEGNYLLLDAPFWRQIKPLLDLAVYVDVAREKVRARLLKRHGEHGLFSHQRNLAHIDNVDLPNYDLVVDAKNRADLIIGLETVA